MQLHKCFAARNHVNWQIKTSHEGSKIWRLKSIVLRRFLNTIQSEENSFQVPTSFPAEERLKTGEKSNNSHLGGCLRRLVMHHLCLRQCYYCLRCHLRLCRRHLRVASNKSCIQLVFQAGSVQKKTQFSSPKPLLIIFYIQRPLHSLLFI